MTGKSNSNKLQSLQILRAIAALMVIVHHFAAAFDEFGNSASYISTFGIGKIGAAGVDIFFVISGFIMFYKHKDNVNTPPISLSKGFLFRRLKRIYPLYWFWCVVLLLLWLGSYALKSHHFTFEYIIFSFLLFPYGSEESVWHPFLDQGWTLAYEVYFYLAFALSLLFKLRIPRVFFIAILFAIVSLVSISILADGSTLNFLNNELVIEFLLGAVVAYIVKISDEKSAKFAVPLQVAGYLLLISNIFFHESTDYRLFKMGIPAFLLVYGAALIRQKEKTKRNYLSHTFVYLGNASYSIYLTHGFFTMTAGALLKKGLFTTVQPDIIIILGTLLATIFGGLSYLFIEKPLMNFLDSKEIKIARRSKIFS